MSSKEKMSSSSFCCRLSSTVDVDVVVVIVDVKKASAFEFRHCLFVSADESSNDLVSESSRHGLLCSSSLKEKHEQASLLLAVAVPIVVVVVLMLLLLMWELLPLLVLLPLLFLLLLSLLLLLLSLLFLNWELPLLLSSLFDLGSNFKFFSEKFFCRHQIASTFSRVAFLVRFNNLFGFC